MPGNDYAGAGGVSRVLTERNTTPPPLPPELAGTYWGQIIRDGWANREAGGTYQGGRTPPTAKDLSGAALENVYEWGGTQVSEKDAAKLQKLGWTYGMPAPKGFTYTARGLLINPDTLTEQFGRAAATAGSVLGTAGVAGAASPAVAALVGGGTSLASAKLGGASWKNALIAGGVGAASAGLGASSLSTPVKAGTQAGINAAGTAAQGGGLRASLASAAQGAAAQAAAPAAGGGSMATATPAANSTSLTNYLIQAGLGAAAGAAASGGDPSAILLGAGAGAAGAAGGRTNTQAAVQTGSSLASKIMSGATAAANAAGNAAAAREAGRQTQADQMVTQDQQRLQATTSRENAVQGRAGVEIDQRAEGRASTNDAYRNALLSALALNTRDVSANRPAGVPSISFSGGARPSAIGPQGRTAAEILNRRALDTLENPRPLMDLPEMESFTPSALPKPSGVDTALGIAGAAGNFLTGMQQNREAAERSSLINALIQQSQQQAAAGLDQPVVAPKPRQQAPDEVLVDPNVWSGVRF